MGLEYFDEHIFYQKVALTGLSEFRQERSFGRIRTLCKAPSGRPFKKKANPYPELTLSANLRYQHSISYSDYDIL